METIFLSADRPEDLARAGKILREGGLVALPTETVYGLGGNALDSSVAAKIYAVKGRPSDNPLIVHIASRDALPSIAAEIPPEAEKLMDAFWPGPLTVIFKKTGRIPDTVTGGLPTVAVRMPSHPAAREIIRAAGVPVAAPSANLSGLPSPSRFEHVKDDLAGRVEAIVDGGDCEVGVESTVVTLVGKTPRVLRPGGVSPEAIRAVLGEIEIDPAVFAPPPENAAVLSPGMKYKHYAPRAEVTVADASLDAFAALMKQNPDAAALCFEGEEELFPNLAVPFGREEDALSEAHALFAALIRLDELGVRRAFARRPKTRGVGLAVMNRLLRASAFRVTVPEKVMVLGLTGPSGAGKSTVAARLLKRGASVIDCDAVTRSPALYGPETLGKLAETFGREILLPDGTLDRRALARRAFASPEGTAALNRITHPVTLAHIRRLVREEAERGAKVIVLDAPTLFESGANALCRRVAVVTAPEETRLSRIMARDGLSEADARVRLSAQKPETFYTERADFVLENGEQIPEAQYEELFAALSL